MLRVVTGPVHSDLEDALVRELRAFKAADPLAPLAVLVPSSHLVARLGERLALSERLSLLNVHLLTFHQLALRLADEHVFSAPGQEPAAMDVMDDLFFRHLVAVVAARHPELGWSLPPGGWAALWATIRDLKDSAVDPHAARQAVAEGMFEADDATSLDRLFRLHAAIEEARCGLGVGAIDDLTVQATSLVEQSQLIAGFAHVFYYGFYDLTQVQLSFFEAVAARVPVTVYYPLSDDPDASYVRRFFDRHLAGLVRASDDLVLATASVPPNGEPGQRDEPERRDEPDKRSSVSPASVQIVSAVGCDDELTLACKTILSLIETHGYDFRDIAVVARTLEPYRASLHRIFVQHRVPFTTTATVPFIEQPAAKVLWQLAALPLSDFAVAPMLELLTSSFARHDGRGGRDEPRLDLWHLAARAVGVRKGEDDWRKLTAGHRSVAGGPNSAQWQIGRTVIPAAHVAALSRAASRLIDDCRALPSDGSVATLTEAFRVLAVQHLAIPGLHGEPAGSAEEQALAAAVQALFDHLAHLDRLYPTVSWANWLELFEEALETIALPLAHDGVGVRVLDAMAARGLPFRALIVLGMNEKTFPRVIREDAFLRDRHRRTLDVTLGYKIDEKLSGYDEERLLFTLVCRAARDRLYLVYQRADAEGRTLAPSPYLAPWLASAAPQDIIHLPRRLADRRDLALFAPSLLTPEELTLRLVLDGHDPAVLLEAREQARAVFVNGCRALRSLESGQRVLNDYDGMVGPVEDHWTRLMARGITPTPLERFARCSFRYFATDLLRLEPVRGLAVDQLPPQDVGDLIHRLLRAAAEQLVSAGWPRMPLGGHELRRRLQPLADEVFRAYADDHAIGYPLLWELTREMVVALVAASLEEDEREFESSGYCPSEFEVEAEGRLTTGPGAQALKVFGRLDRVDRHPDGAVRIIDYKYKQGRTLRVEDKDLVVGAVRAVRLQPPLYALLSIDGQTAEQVEFRLLMPQGERTVESSVFDGAVWTGPSGEHLRRTLGRLLDALREGAYVMVPDDNTCESCDVAAACRRYHGPSWWRSYTSGPAAWLRRLRKEKVEA